MHDNLDFIPEISFIPTTLEQIIYNMIVEYESEYTRLTGKTRKIAPADPERIMLQTQAYRLYQTYELIDHTAKMNFLKYATGAYLDNLGAMVMVERLKPKAAICTVQFMLSAAVGEVVVIPIGTRISPGDSIFFATTVENYISIGETSIIATVVCGKVGTVGNEYATGSINVLVDPVNYVTKAINIERSQGGADLETDENLRMRIYLKPDSFSVAGPDDSYRYFAFEYSQQVADCNVHSPVPGDVIVVVILQGGEIPQAAFLSEVFAYLQNKRPLTDNLSVTAPSVVNYNLDITYYIANPNKNQAEIIKTNSLKAIDDFVNWQKTKLGRDVNPNELTRRLMDCGIKRVEISSPNFTVLQYNEIAIANEVSVNFGGFENE